MGRKTAILGFSVSPDLASEYEKLAEQEGTTKSGLFRRMVQRYKAARDEEELFRLEPGAPNSPQGAQGTCVH